MASSNYPTRIPRRWLKAQAEGRWGARECARRLRQRGADDPGDLIFPHDWDELNVRSRRPND